MSADSLEVKILPGRQRRAAARAWKEVEALAPARRLVSSWAWVDTWLDHYGSAVPHRFAIGRSGGSARGVALIVLERRRRGPLRVRTVRLGTAGEPQGEGAYACYHQLLAAPGEEAEFASALAERLDRDRRWDELMIERYEPAAARALAGAFKGMDVEIEDAPTVDLRLAATHGGDVLATLKPRTRQQTRRSMRELGEISTEVAETVAEGEDILDELIELHQRRWRAQGEPGVFAGRLFEAFQRALVRELLPSGGVMLFRARAASGTVGCVLNVIDGDRALSHLQGLMPFDAHGAKVKPGFVTHVLCMQACLARGVAEYDLLPDASPYKLELSNSMSQLVSGRLVRPKPALVAVEGGRRAKRFLRGRLRAS